MFETTQPIGNVSRVSPRNTGFSHIGLASPTSRPATARTQHVAASVGWPRKYVSGARTIPSANIHASENSASVLRSGCQLIATRDMNGDLQDRTRSFAWLERPPMRFATTSDDSRPGYHVQRLEISAR